LTLDERRFFVNIKVSTVLSIGLLILAFVFATLGLVKAGDLRIAPLAITAYMVVSAVMFAVLAVRGIRRKEMWQRLLGVGAIMATLFMLFMAIGLYIVLTNIQVPTF
jgi:hypothetical protein